MSTNPIFVELTADVLKIFLQKAGVLQYRWLQSRHISNNRSPSKLLLPTTETPPTAKSYSRIAILPAYKTVDDLNPQIFARTKQQSCCAHWVLLHTNCLLSRNIILHTKVKLSVCPHCCNITTHDDIKILLHDYTVVVVLYSTFLRFFAHFGSSHSHLPDDITHELSGKLIVQKPTYLSTPSVATMASWPTYENVAICRSTMVNLLGRVDYRRPRASYGSMLPPRVPKARRIFARCGLKHVPGTPHVQTQIDNELHQVDHIHMELLVPFTSTKKMSNATSMHCVPQNVGWCCSK